MNYLIAGMGKSGAAALQLLKKTGLREAEIFTWDAKPGVAQYHNTAELMSLPIDFLVVSPGVPLKTSWIQELLNKKMRLTSEIGLAAQFLTTEKVIAVTGSYGKSTTVSLLAAAAESAGIKFFLGGNIGTPLAEYTCAVLSGERPRAEWLILELSSFQLENCAPLKVDFAAITALSANHLERYTSQQEYYETKWSLRKMSRYPLFINKHGEDLLSFAQTQSLKDFAVVSPEDSGLSSLNLKSAKLVGFHNQQNLAIAATLARAAGWNEKFLSGLLCFPGLEHRLEFITQKSGITYFNDSKATAIESVLTAIEACLQSLSLHSKLFCLVGGRDKNLPWEKLSLKQNPLLEYVFFGECGELAKRKSQQQGACYKKLVDAFNHAQSKAQTGDMILLSPGGSSLDEFKNFEERGRYFKSLIAKETK